MHSNIYHIISFNTIILYYLHIIIDCYNIIGFHEKYWNANLVDVYIDPITQLLTVAHQIAYCSITHSLSRRDADSFAVILERELPIVMSYRLVYIFICIYMYLIFAYEILCY